MAIYGTVPSTAQEPLLECTRCPPAQLIQQHGAVERVVETGTVRPGRSLHHSGPAADVERAPADKVPSPTVLMSEKRMGRTTRLARQRGGQNGKVTLANTRSNRESSFHPGWSKWLSHFDHGWSKCLCHFDPRGQNAFAILTPLWSKCLCHFDPVWSKCLCHFDHPLACARFRPLRDVWQLPRGRLYPLSATVVCARAPKARTKRTGKHGASVLYCT